ncbi:MAG: hypothetical protein ACI82I_001035, partial [Gammaproteobacteria bacterium]
VGSAVKSGATDLANDVGGDMTALVTP